MTVGELINELSKYPPDTLVGVIAPNYDWDLEQATDVSHETVTRYNSFTMKLPEGTPYLRIM